MTEPARKVKAKGNSGRSKQKEIRINNLSGPVFRIDRMAPPTKSTTKEESTLPEQKDEVPSLGEEKTDLNDQNSQNSPSALDTAQIQTTHKAQLLNFRKARDQLEQFIFNQESKNKPEQQKEEEVQDFSKRDLKAYKQKLLDRAQYAVTSRVSEAKENEITTCYLKEDYINEFKGQRLAARKAAIECVQEAISDVKRCEKELQEDDTKEEEYQVKREILKQQLAKKLSTNQSLSQIEIYQRPFEIKDFNGKAEELVQLFDPLPAQPKTQIEKKMKEVKNARNPDQMVRKKEGEKVIKKAKQKSLQVSERLKLQTHLINQTCHTESDVLKLDFNELREIMNCKFVTVVLNCPDDQIINFSQIEKLTVNEIGDDGFIFFWTTSKYLDRAFSLIKRWGYNLIDEIKWTKLDQAGRLTFQIKNVESSLLINAHQICVAGYKSHSNTNPDYVSKIQNDLMSTAGEVENQKPDQFYLTIECMTPGTAKLELFSQEPRQGWITIAHKDENSDYYQCSVCDKQFSHQAHQRFKCKISEIELCAECFFLTQQDREDVSDQSLVRLLAVQEPDLKNAKLHKSGQIFLKIPALNQIEKSALECSHCKKECDFGFFKLSATNAIYCEGCFDSLGNSEKEEMSVTYSRITQELKHGKRDQIIEAEDTELDQPAEESQKVSHNPSEIIVKEPRRVRYCNVCQSKIKERTYYSCSECYELACCQSCHLISCGMKINFLNFTHSQSHKFHLVCQQSGGAGEVAEEEESELS